MKNKRIMTTALAILALSCSSVAPAADKEPIVDPQVEKEVRAAEKQRVEALLKGDGEVLKRLMADDFTYITHTGELRLKAHRLRDIQTKAIRYTFLSNDIVDLRIYGDTVLVHGFTRRKGEAPGRKLDGTYRFTRLWVKKDGRWQVVHTHLTKAPQE